MAHPQLVGNSFVSQYYNVLHQSPHVVHRFYTDASSLTRAEVGPEGHVDTVFGQDRIHEKVMSMDYMGLRAEIKTVDCQNSFSGSVLVMVTGSLFNRAHEKRDFVQTFFLAPQLKGYFVYNDVFRYIGEPQASDSAYMIPNGVSEHSPTPESVGDPAHLEVSESTPVAPEEQVDEGYDLPHEMPQQEDVDDEVPVEETVQSVTLETDEAVDVEDSQKDLPKKSYASILRVIKDGYVQSVPQPQKSTPVPVEKTIHVAASPQMTPTSSPALPPPVDTAEENATPQDVQGDGKAIYIKSLPMTITAAQLDEEFKRFGAVKPGCTNVKKQQNVCYAFLEFEDVSAARAAIEASPIQITGRSVYIEEKKPLGARGAYRARGRGRGDGTRGRGGYYGGRGAGRNYEPTGRGRGGPRGGYNHSGSANQDRPSYVNNNSNDDASSSYHPRYDHNNTQNYQSNNSNGSGSHNNFFGTHPRARRYARNNSVPRNPHNPPSQAPATVTAA